MMKEYSLDLPTITLRAITRVFDQVPLFGQSPSELAHNVELNSVPGVSMFCLLG